MDAWVVEALRVGYRIPFDRLPPLSERPLSLPAYSPQSIRGVALTQELQDLLRKGAVEPAPQSPGFYSHLFLVQKASGSWRPIIDLLTLNNYITSARFHMETPRSVLNSIRPGDWMISLDLQDAHLQVPVHHDSRRFLRFVVAGKAYQFRVLLFRSYDCASSLHEDYGTSVRHPPQARGQDALLPGRLAHPGLDGNRLHSVKGQAPSSLQRTRHPGQLQEVVSSAHSVSSVLRHGDSISAFYRSSHTSMSQQSRPPYRGVPVNPVSSGVPLASSSRPPVLSDSSRLRRNDQDKASPALSQGPVGLSGRPVPGLLVPSLSRGSSLVVEGGSAARGSESLYSSSRHQLLLGRFGCRLGSPRRRTPCLGPLASPSEGSLYQHERASSSSARPAGLRTPACGNVGSYVLRQHHHSSLPSSFGRDVLCHSKRHSTGDSPLGGESPHSSSAPVHHGVIQCHRGRSESPQSGDRVRVDPSPGSNRSAGPQMASSDRSLRDFTDGKSSSVLFASLRSAGSGDGCPSPVLGRSPSLRLSSDRHHKESASQTEVLEELRVDSHSSVLASEGLVPRSSGTIIRRSRHTVRSKRSSKTAPLPPVPPKPAYASGDCMATIKRFTIQAGFSPAVAGQLVFSRRLSTRLNYQARWGTYRKWCKDFRHRSSSPSIAKIADFLTFMFKTKGAALSTIKGYRAMLAAVFEFPLPEISTSPILKDLIRSFEISAPRPIFPPPPWELDKVLQFLSQGLHLSPLREHLSWTRRRRPCSFLPWLRLNGFRSSKPCHSPCHSRVRIWCYIMTHSSVRRRSLLPILFPVLSLFRLYRTLLVTCPSEFIALSELLITCVRLLGQLRSFRRGCSSHLGILNVPCHSIFDSSLLTVVPCLLPVHLGLMTFVVFPHLSITTVISLCPTLCRLLRGGRTVFSLLATLKRSLPHRIISSSLAHWLLLGIG